MQGTSFVNVCYLEYFATGRRSFISTATICHFRCFLFTLFAPHNLGPVCLQLRLVSIVFHWFSQLDLLDYQLHIKAVIYSQPSSSVKFPIRLFQFSLVLNSVLIFFNFAQNIQIGIWAAGALWDRFSDLLQSNLVCLYVF